MRCTLQEVNKAVKLLLIVCIFLSLRIRGVRAGCILQEHFMNLICLLDTHTENTSTYICEVRLLPVMVNNGIRRRYRPRRAA